MSAAPCTVAATVRGADHVAKGTPCQDAHAVARAGGAVAAAVADGAGSRKRSEEGSTAAVTAAVEAACGVLAVRPRATRAAALAALAAARDAVEQRAADLDTDLGELACTLAVAVIGVSHATVASIGDTVGVLRDRNGGLRTFAQAPPSEFANTTVFLTASKWTHHVVAETAALEDVDGLLIGSDGVEPLLLGGDSQWVVPATAHPLLDLPVDGFGDAELARFLSSPAVSRRSADDCTLAILRTAARDLDGLRLASSVELPAGTSARLISSSPGLLAVDVGDGLTEAELDRAIGHPPDVWRQRSPTPRLLWPVRRVEAGGQAWPVVLRPEGGLPLADALARPGASERDALVAKVEDVVAALHAAGKAHGSLSTESFVVAADGEPLLCDLSAAMLRPSPASVRDADRSFLADLAGVGRG